MKLQKNEVIDIRWNEEIQKHIISFKYKGITLNKFSYYVENLYPEDIAEFIWSLDRDVINEDKEHIEKFLEDKVVVKSNN